MPLAGARLALLSRQSAPTIPGFLQPSPAQLVVTAPNPGGLVSDVIEVDTANLVVTAPNPGIQVVDAAFANGYLYRRAVPISATGAATLINFPMLFDNIDWPASVLGAMKSAANGGKVASDSGFDIRFENAAGTKLAHEIILYTPATGRLQAQVLVPTLNLSTQAVLYIYYGKSGLTETEATPSAVWVDYATVWRGDTGVDRSGNGHNMTATSVTATTLNDQPAGLFNGTTGAMSMATWDAYGGQASISVEAYVSCDADAIGTNRGIICEGPLSGQSSTHSIALFQRTQSGPLTPPNVGRQKPIFNNMTGVTEPGYWGSNADQQIATDPVMYASCGQNGIFPQVYQNGVRLLGPDTEGVTANATVGVLKKSTQATFYIGEVPAPANNPAAGKWKGSIAWVRFSYRLLSAAWNLAVSRNCQAASSFHGLGSEGINSDTVEAFAAAPMRVAASLDTEATINVVAAAYNPDAATLTIESAGTPTKGTATIDGDNILYTPTSSGVDEWTYTLTDGTRSSFGRIYVDIDDGDVTGEAIPPRIPTRATTLAVPNNGTAATVAGDLPTAERTIVMTWLQCQAYFENQNAAGVPTGVVIDGTTYIPIPGDHVVFTSNQTDTELITIKYNRSGTDSDPIGNPKQGLPIVIRGTGPDSISVKGKFDVQAHDIVIWGLKWEDMTNDGFFIAIAGLSSTTKANRVRVARCAWRRWKCIQPTGFAPVGDGEYEQSPLIKTLYCIRVDKFADQTRIDHNHWVWAPYRNTFTLTQAPEVGWKSAIRFIGGGGGVVQGQIINDIDIVPVNNTVPRDWVVDHNIFQGATSNEWPNGTQDLFRWDNTVAPGNGDVLMHRYLQRQQSCCVAGESPPTGFQKYRGLMFRNWHRNFKGSPNANTTEWKSSHCIQYQSFFDGCWGYYAPRQGRQDGFYGCRVVGDNATPFHVFTFGGEHEINSCHFGAGSLVRIMMGIIPWNEVGESSGGGATTSNQNAAFNTKIINCDFVTGSQLQLGDDYGTPPPIYDNQADETTIAACTFNGVLGTTLAGLPVAIVKRPISSWTGDPAGTLGHTGDITVSGDVPSGMITYETIGELDATTVGPTGVTPAED